MSELDATITQLQNEVAEKSKMITQLEAEAGNKSSTISKNVLLFQNLEKDFQSFVSTQQSLFDELSTQISELISQSKVDHDMISQFKNQLSQQTVDFSRLDTDHDDLLDRFEAVAQQKSRSEDQLNSLKELLNEQSVVMESNFQPLRCLKVKI
ncbi:hypothetical protein GEMRC1_010687 [Eukaryota sp. GEM-RC1]